jgi:hypothetical protein
VLIVTKVRINVYCPPLQANDGRPELGARALEAALPGESLSFSIGSAAEREPISNRPRWLARIASEGRIPIVCNEGYEGSYVGLMGFTWPSAIAPGGSDLLLAAAEAPLVSSLPRVEEMLSSLAGALDAFWGVVLSPAATGLWHDQAVLPGSAAVPPFELPVLAQPNEIESPLVPLFFGWVSYWSAGTVERLGFPTHAEQPGPFVSVHRLADGAWILRLTEEPLDPARPEHLARLRAAYERFPSVGGRDRLSQRSPSVTPEFVPTSGVFWIESYAPALVRDEQRLEHSMRALEKVLGVGLKFTTAEDDDELMVPIEDRSARLARALERAQTIPSLFDEDEDVHVFFMNDDSIAAPNGEKGVLYTRCECAPAALTARDPEPLIADFALALAAFWAVLDPPAATGLALNQVVRPWHPDPAFGLPALRMQQDLESPLLPWRLGWLNYWSKETAARVRFPLTENDKGPFAEVRALTDGAWLLRLTQEPLDPSRPDHLVALRAAYERLPAIGGRDAPAR